MMEATEADNPIEADSGQDEGYAETETSSLLSSVATEIRRGKEENGRIYPNYGSHEYGLPVDDEELDRLDLNHHKYTLVQNDKLFLAPIGDHPQRILDLGTGTGIWAIDVADMFPSATVIGNDLAPVQPQWVPPNCQFEVDDVEADWTHGRNSFDYIHNRDFYHSIRNWPRLIEQCYDHLKPGGYLELSGVYPVATSDDDTLPADSAFAELAGAFQEIGDRINSEPKACTKFKSWLEAQGFVDVVQTILKIPSSPWPKDKRLKKIGAYELMNVCEGARAFMLRGWGEFGKTREELEMLIMRTRKELTAQKSHCYVPFYVVYGRKSENAPERAGAP